MLNSKKLLIRTSIFEVNISWNAPYKCFCAGGGFSAGIDISCIVTALQAESLYLFSASTIKVALLYSLCSLWLRPAASEAAETCCLCTFSASQTSPTLDAAVFMGMLHPTAPHVLPLHSLSLLNGNKWNYILCNAAHIGRVFSLILQLHEF